MNLEKAFGLENIKDLGLKELTIKILEEYGDEDKLEKSNRVYKIIVELLKRKKLITSDKDHGQAFVDILFSACYLYNLLYDKDKVSTIFLLREIVEQEEYVSQALVNGLLQTVEGQDGPDAPGMLKPAVNSPTELFADAVFIENMLSNWSV